MSGNFIGSRQNSKFWTRACQQRAVLSDESGRSVISVESYAMSVVVFLVECVRCRHFTIPKSTRSSRNERYACCTTSWGARDGFNRRPCWELDMDGLIAAVRYICVRKITGQKDDS